MDKDMVENVRNFFEIIYKQVVNADAVAVVSTGEAGEYKNNPTIKEQKEKGNKLIDGNMFAQYDERGEILIFVPEEKKVD